MKSSLKIAESILDLESFLRFTIDKSNFELSQIKLSEQQEWNLIHGVLGHRSGGFFYITGLVDNISGREQLVLYQPQGAFNGLVVCKQEKNVYILLQARIEPGNSGIGQYGPTIQSTPANYLRFHGGKETPYFDFFFKYNPQVQPIANSMQLDLGKRYFQKSKILSYVESVSLVETAENMIWVPLEIITEVLHYDNFFNTDLRSMIGVFDWDLFLNKDRSTSDTALTSENNPYFDNNLSSKNMGKLVPISQLQNWELTDEGIVDRANSGVSANIYKVTTATREVKNWVQPLLCTANRGLITLLMRQVDNKPEFLIAYQSEFGISGEKVLLPSYIIYPGENYQNKTTLYKEGKVLCEVIQSEEGGRFYLNENIYQIILVDSTFENEDEQFWVSGDTLKGLLKTSNKVSIQLRCIASLILKNLNPYTLGN
jgi:oxidase EvaA